MSKHVTLLVSDLVPDLPTVNAQSLNRCDVTVTKKLCDAVYCIIRKCFRPTKNYQTLVSRATNIHSPSFCTEHFNVDFDKPLNTVQDQTDYI